MLNCKTSQNMVIGIISSDRFFPISIADTVSLWISKFNVGLKSLLNLRLSATEFYGDLVYKFKKNMGRSDF